MFVSRLPAASVTTFQGFKPTTSVRQRGASVPKDELESSAEQNTSSLLFDGSDSFIVESNSTFKRKKPGAGPDRYGEKNILQTGSCCRYTEHARLKSRVGRRALLFLNAPHHLSYPELSLLRRPQDGAGPGAPAAHPSNREAQFSLAASSTMKAVVEETLWAEFSHTSLSSNTMMGDARFMLQVKKRDVAVGRWTDDGPDGSCRRRIIQRLQP
ncbi:hypothetical protein D4764_10G0009630 [Takifugu flavidus]|uniref:Uncharacterized protein n=1 Tax=Takifugu flavidus TaxID=433684 RepID=A0A5C6PKQ3_9TELE|nr:hypothetical protein D4764_10G0009630 [Takifugu flavidus]